MPDQVRPIRPAVDDRLSVASFKISVYSPKKGYEVAIASDPALFKPEGKAKRTRSNFYSSRATGLQPVTRGEAVYIVPPEVLARFAGQEKLYYALATFPAGNAPPEIAAWPSEASAYVSLRGFTGRSLKRLRVLPTRQRAASKYGNGGGNDLEWAGDTIMPGTQTVNVVPPPSGAGTGAAASQTPPPQPAAASAAGLGYDDGFGYLPPPQPRQPQRVPARTQSGESFTINWDDVQAIAQPTDVSCWATSGAMVAGWRDQMSLTPDTIARIAGRTTATGLDAAQVGQFAKDLGLVAEDPRCYTIEGFRQMLEQFGPLWVGAAMPGPHVIVVTGMYSDGAADGSDSYVRVADPWDRVVGTPGAPGDYLKTHNTGSRYILSWADFVREYEGAADIPGANLLILHAPGDGSRQPNRLGAAGYALAAAGARAQESTSWTVNWDDVDMFPQPTRDSCWATAAAMVLGWRDRVCVSAEVVAGIFERTTGNGLDPDDRKAFAEKAGLEYEAPQCYTSEDFRSLLENYGPLWVGVLWTIKEGGGHAVVVTGMCSDGAPDGSDTYVRITDPWDRDPGSPGAPGPYINIGENELPKTGSRYIMKWADFVREYEERATVADDGTVNVQILRAGDTGGRTPNRTGAPAYAMTAASSKEVSEYPQASRFAPAAAGNYEPMSAYRTITHIVIHIAESPSTKSTVNTFRNPANKRSAHYVVGQDGEVVQMVRHNDVAQHAHDANAFSIGIEHIASTGKGGFPKSVPTDVQYCASAALTRWLCQNYGIPIDRTHIVGHKAIDPKTTHDCPGNLWDWDYFMGMVESGTCYARTQSLAAAGNGGGQVILPEPPPPVPRSVSMAAPAAAAIGGIAIEKIRSHDGKIFWELDQLRGLKHPNDTAPAPAAPFKDAPTIRLDKWPYIAPDGETTSAWFAVDWQFNGQSLGNVRIANIGTNGALQRSLHVTACVLDDNVVYPEESPAYAALRIRVRYRFASVTGSESIAVTDLHLFGDGSYDSNSRWERADVV